VNLSNDPVHIPPFCSQGDFNGILGRLFPFLAERKGPLQGAAVLHARQAAAESRGAVLEANGQSDNTTAKNCRSMIVPRWPKHIRSLLESSYDLEPLSSFLLFPIEGFLEFDTKEGRNFSRVTLETDKLMSCHLDGVAGDI
jgi:hypothetical protein